MPTPTPLVINLFGGPGSGKSTLAALVYAAFKTKPSSLAVELCTEFAKALVYEGRWVALKNQALVIGEQAQRIERVVGKVDIVITDSPILLSAIYRPVDYPACFDEFALWLHGRYPSTNVLVRRPRGSFETAGRFQTETEARTIDQRIQSLLRAHDLPFLEAAPEPTEAERIARTVADLVNRRASAA